MKKYKLTDNKKKILGKTLYQIESLTDFGFVHVGDKGGWIEKEENLSQDGNAWVCGDARVCDNAQVFGNAWVCGDARIYGNAQVFGNACVYGDARVFGNAEVLWITKIGSRLGTTTAFRNKDKGISIACGCFRGTLKEFEEKVKQTHGNNKFAREYNLLIELIKVHFEV